MNETGGFRFRSGRLCLDFTATLAARHREPVEQLAKTTDLGRWFVAASLAGQPPVITADELLQARQLREAVHRLVHQETRERPGSVDIDTLNLWASHCGPRPTLHSDARSSSLVAKHPVSAALSSIASDAIDLLTGPRLGSVRECERPDCSVLILDTTRTQQRRWCDMARCGNQEKAARHRHRRKATPHPSSDSDSELEATRS